jgi:hypothetical protein
MSENPRRRRADDGPVPTLVVDLTTGGGRSDFSANDSQEAHEKRVARLVDAGWERTDDGWLKDVPLVQDRGQGD